MNQKLIVTVSVDDTNPSENYRLLGTPVEGWMRDLNERFGAKFTNFVPSCYHRKYPLSRHKSWVNELNSIEWLELAAHGHYHMTSNPHKYGECEFAELNAGELIGNRLWLSLESEWNCCGLDINDMGWRNPGWLCSENAHKYIDRTFKYVALHYEHNHGLKWNCKTFFGHDGIQQENISIHNGNMIMFQSHIYGNHNHNVWNQQNYEQLKISLEYLTENYDCEFKLLHECI